MYYLLNPETRHILIARENIEELLIFLREATNTKEVKDGLKSLHAVIAVEVISPNP